VTGPTWATLEDGRAHFQHGPTDLIITIDAAPEVVEAGLAAGWMVFETLLEGLVVDLDMLRSDVEVLPSAEVVECSTSTATQMVEAAKQVATGGFLTPMAAVAGSIADTVCQAITDVVADADADADAMADSGPSADTESAGGMWRVIVNNGGDISLALGQGASLTVGIVDLSTGARLGSVNVDHDHNVRGVATSGRGGRSLSMGIADSVTVLASSAALADAAATRIASAVDLEGFEDDRLVHRRPANEIDGATDLEDRLVVVGVEPLTLAQQDLALKAGGRVASRLIENKTITAAYLKLDQRCLVMDQKRSALSPSPAGILT